MIKLFVYVVIVLMLNFVNGDPPLGETLIFLAKDWTISLPIPNAPKLKYVTEGSSFAINCTTNDLSADIFLLKRPGTNRPYVDALAGFGKRMKVIDQTFVIIELELGDSNMYACLAKNKVNEVNKELGTLTVTINHKAVKPEIFPKSPIELEEGREQFITCRTKPGKATTDLSYLTWFRNVSESLLPINPTRTAREEETLADGTFIDIEILIFPNFSDSDIGTYVCQRKVGSQQETYASVQVNKAANKAPVVNFPEVNDTVVYIGEYAYINFLCSVGGIPRPKKYWKKDGKILVSCSNNEDSDCKLQLRNTQHPRDSGVYYCYGENLVGTVNKSLDIQVKVSPELEKSKTILIASYDDDYELDCIVQNSNPLPTIQWHYQEDSCTDQKDCKPLDEDWKPFLQQSPGREKPTNSSYIVSKATRINLFFRCSATNMVDSDDHTIKLVRQEIAPPQFSLSPDAETYTVNEDEKILIVCSTDIYVFVDVKLHKDGQPLPFMTYFEKNTRHTNYSVFSAKLSDKGKYECIATLRRGGIKTKSVNLLVSELQPPKIINFVDGKVSQDVNADETLNCDARGNPPPVVSWEFNGNDLSNNPYIEGLQKCANLKSGVYLITGKDNQIAICGMNYKKHSGTYKCIAKNKIGTASMEMRFTIEAKPKIVDWVPEIVVRTLESSEIPCTVEANPAANVTWLRFNPETKKYNYISSNMTSDILVLNDIQGTHSGIYVCNGKSELGEVSQELQVRVKSSAGGIVGTTSGKTTVGVIVGAVIILLIVLILVFLYRRHLKKKYALYLEPNEKFIMDPDRSLFDQSNDLPYDPAFEFPRERLTFLKTLGSGAFGEVWLAEAEGIHNFLPRDKSAAATKRRKSMTRQRRRYHSISVRYRKQLDATDATLEKTMVAVKTLKEGAAENEYKDLASELKILIHLGEHKNIVNLLGACTMKGNLCVILECCPHGSLLTFLRSKRDIFQPLWTKHDSDMENEFTYIDLLMIAFQITKGMDFLQSKKCVHRDLAARNVLVGEDYIIKIADFGLARDIYKDEFYLKQTTGLLPVKWMAPESLFDKVYTSTSDVWSYGIVLWEIFTLGGSPYPGLPTEDLYSFLEDGKRMDRPEVCPAEVYEIMIACWKKSPYERPLFTNIGEQLSNVMKQNVQNDNDYLDFTDCGNDYLQPETNGLQRYESNEYLEATADLNPSGQTYIPPHPQDKYVGQDSSLPTSPAEGYVPMTPADHYKSPSFRYDGPKEAVV